MRCPSLKTGLGWLVGLVLLLTSVINLSILIMHAGPRTRAEDETGLHLTRELVLMGIASLQETDDPLPALRRFYDSLENLRHVDVKVVGNDDPAPIFAPRPPSKAEYEAPYWFVALIHTPPKMPIVPVTIKGANYGRIALISNPIDELAEKGSETFSRCERLHAHIRYECCRPRRSARERQTRKGQTP